MFSAPCSIFFPKCYIPELAYLCLEGIHITLHFQHYHLPPKFHELCQCHIVWIWSSVDFICICIFVLFLLVKWISFIHLSSISFWISVVLFWVQTFWFCQFLFNFWGCCQEIPGVIVSPSLEVIDAFQRNDAFSPNCLYGCLKAHLSNLSMVLPLFAK